MTNTDSEYKRTCTCTGKVHWRDTTCHQSEKPQPEQWEDRLMDEFCVMFERAGDDRMVESLESFIRSILSRQKEQMLEVLRGIISRPHLCDSCAYHVCEYQVALSDVEEKIKAL